MKLSAVIKKAITNITQNNNHKDDPKWHHLTDVIAGPPAGFKNVDAQPVWSGASLREMIRNIDNYFATG